MYIVYDKGEMAHEVVPHIDGYKGLWEVKAAWLEPFGNKMMRYHTDIRVHAYKDRETIEDDPEKLGKKVIKMEHSPLLVMAKLHPMADAADRGMRLCDTIVPIDTDADEELVVTYQLGEGELPEYGEGDSIALVSIELAMPAEWVING